MQTPQEPFASLGLAAAVSENTTVGPTSTGTATTTTAAAATASSSETLYTFSTLPPLLSSSDASQSSGVSNDATSVASSSSHAAVSPKNPFENPAIRVAPAAALAGTATPQRATTRTTPAAMSPAPTTGTTTSILSDNNNIIKNNNSISTPLSAASPNRAATSVAPMTPPRTALIVSPVFDIQQQPQQTTPLPSSPANRHSLFSPQQQQQTDGVAASLNGMMTPQMQQQQQHYQVNNNNSMNNNIQPLDDDENTAPSSAANTLDQQQQHLEAPHAISRFIENTKRRIGDMNNNINNNRRDSEDNNINTDDNCSLISGFLQKLGRNGKWQTRWFESDGASLSYYKSAKRTKLLATLDLQKVGFIEVDKEDKQEYSFRIQVQGRLYNLRASSRASCRDWVITLNRVKEASMQQGNVKLVVGNLSSIDLLNNKTSNINSPTTHGGTPRVVVVSNRQRTRAVDPDEEEPWGDQLIRVVDDGEDRTDPAYNARRSALSTVVAARWTKHQSSLQRLGTKLSAWARSLKKYSCATTNMEGQPQPNAVYLDRHVHPPGHDDKFDKTKAPSSAKMTMQPYEISPRKKEFNSWLETESALAASTAAALPLDEDEQQLATGSAKAAILPLAMADRSSSMASSDYDSRMLS